MPTSTPRSTPSGWCGWPPTADGLATVIVRPGFVYGPGDRRFLPKLLDALGRGQFAYVGDGGKLLNLSYVDDVAAGDAPRRRGAGRRRPGLQPDRRDGDVAAGLRGVPLLASSASRLRRSEIPPAVGWAAAYAVEGLARARRAKEAPRLSRGRMRFLYYNQHYSGEKAQPGAGLPAAVHVPRGRSADAGLVPGAGPASRVGGRRPDGRTVRRRRRHRLHRRAGGARSWSAAASRWWPSAATPPSSTPCRRGGAPGRSTSPTGWRWPRRWTGCRAVINCVGSFLDLGEAVVDAAVAAGGPLRRHDRGVPVPARVFDVPRRRRPGRPASPSCPAWRSTRRRPTWPPALAARALGRPPESVEIGYRLDRGPAVQGARCAPTFAGPASPAPSGRTGGSSPGGSATTRGRSRFPEPYGPATVARWPGGEVLSVPRHTGARSVAVYPRHAESGGRRVPQPSPHRTAPAGRAGPRRPGTGGPSAEARNRARFVIVAEARAASDETRCVVEGHDLYGVTAAACAEAAQRLGASPASHCQGRWPRPKRSTPPASSTPCRAISPGGSSDEHDTVWFPPRAAPACSAAGWNGTSTRSASTSTWSASP